MNLDKAIVHGGGLNGYKRRWTIKPRFYAFIAAIILIVGAFVIGHVARPDYTEPETDTSITYKQLQAQIEQAHKRLQETDEQLKKIQAKLEAIQDRLDALQHRQDEILGMLDLSAAEIYTVTAYAPLDPDAVPGLDYWGDPTVSASGDRPIPHLTVAADPSIPFGSKVWIEGLGLRVVNDRGGAIKGNRLDLCMATREEALQFGKQQRRVLVFDKAVNP